MQLREVKEVVSREFDELLGVGEMCGRESRLLALVSG